MGTHVLAVAIGTFVQNPPKIAIIARCGPAEALTDAVLPVAAIDEKFRSGGITPELQRLDAVGTLGVIPVIFGELRPDSAGRPLRHLITTRLLMFFQFSEQRKDFETESIGSMVWKAIKDTFPSFNTQVLQDHERLLKNCESLKSLLDSYFQTIDAPAAF